MATSKIQMPYELYKNQSTGGKASGKWYPQPVIGNTLNTRGMAKHITSHGSTYTFDTIIGVLTAFTTCLVELVSQGHGVKMDGLGTFKPTFEGVVGGATDQEVIDGYNINEKLAGIHIRFWPESVEEDNITSREFKKQVQTRLVGLYDGKTRKKVYKRQIVDYDTPETDNSQQNDDSQQNG